jgi:predicted MFS family arabinose efflux permease
MGPVFGAALNATLGWRWIFWFLAILSGTCLICICFTLPKTARTIVGNGTISAHGIYKVPYRKMAPEACPAEHSEPLERQHWWKVINPLTCLKVLLFKDSAIVLVALGIQYMALTCIQASLSTLFIDIYKFNQLDSGLIYLPFGCGCAIAALLIGTLAFFLGIELISDIFQASR